ncbi:MAG: hypothetical protein ACRD8O_22680 [Bryobacteraceae bacterium]
MAIQFCLAHPYAATTLVGMATRGQVRQNAAAAEGKLDQELIEEIRHVVARSANIIWPTGRPENHDGDEPF